MKRSTLYSIAVLACIAAMFFLMTAGTAKQECHVCMEYAGRSNCATAAGPTDAVATETAKTTACGPITAGMNDVIACGNRPPVSLQCRSR